MDASTMGEQLRDRADSLERGERPAASGFALQLRDAADLLVAESQAGAIAQSRIKHLRHENAELRAAERGLRAALVMLDETVAAQNAQLAELSVET